MKKVTPSIPATHFKKVRSFQALLFENLVGGSTPFPTPAEGGGGGALYGKLMASRGFETKLCGRKVMRKKGGGNCSVPVVQ